MLLGELGEAVGEAVGKAVGSEKSGFSGERVHWEATSEPHKVHCDVGCDFVV